VNKNELTLAVSWDRYALGAAYLRRHPPRFFTALYSKPARSYRPWDKYKTISLDEAYVNAGLGVA
jgi:hypothetical protein